MSLFNYLSSEFQRGCALENDEERFSSRREKMYTFMKIPREVEKFMLYGFFQCVDAFLSVFTFLPLRVIIASVSLFFWPVKKIFRQNEKLQPFNHAGICDLLKIIIIIICTILMSYLDTSVLYHIVKSQSIIKLYIFFNLLEVGDRLFSAFGQDTMDALMWTATEPGGHKRKHFGVLPHLFLAVIYVFLHAILVLFQATTLNVAINSRNKVLLTIMMSNNFVELKGSVFKKFDKSNLFQLSCNDVRERFHLCILLLLVTVQTLKEYDWSLNHFWVLLPDCVTVLFCELFIDWIKHAFITRFNEIRSDVYQDYTLFLAYDLASSKFKQTFFDYSDSVSHRMGFVSMPLAVLIIRIFYQSFSLTGLAAYVLLFIFFLWLISFRILISIILIGKACNYIDIHRQKRNETGDYKKFDHANHAKSHPSSRKASWSTLDKLNCHVPISATASISDLESTFVQFESLKSLYKNGISLSKDICDDAKLENARKKLNNIETIDGHIFTYKIDENRNNSVSKDK